MSIKDLANWKVLSTSIATVALLAMLTQAGRRAQAAWLEYRDVVASVHAHMSPQEQALATEQAKVLEQIAKDIKAIKIQGATVTGLARVLNTDTADVFLQVNTLGRAEGYTKQAKARVTNLSSEDSPTITVSVDGTFRNVDENYLVLLSKRAAALLGIRTGQTVRVRIEPVQKDE